MTPAHVEDQLSTTEWLLYGALFVILPILNILVSSMLYYRWRYTTPNRAGQINKLGWAIFGIQMLFTVLRDR